MRISLLMGIGGSLILVPVIIALMYPLSLKTWPLYLVYELIGVILIIVAVKYQKKTKFIQVINLTLQRTPG
jgi:hypothetical protein